MHLALVASQTVGVALQLASYVTTQVGRAGFAHVPPANEMGSVMGLAIHPPTVVPKFSSISG